MAIGRNALLGGALVAGITLTHDVRAQSTQGRGSMCVKDVAPQTGMLGYQMRGDTHCEGLYEQLVAPGSLEPVSLVRADHPVPPASYQLAWPMTDSSSEVSVQAFAFRPRLLYRMDTRRSSGGFDWPTTILRQLKLREQEIGVIATTEIVINRMRERVYLPVDLNSGAKSPSGLYLLKMASAEDLSEVFLTIIGPMKGNKPGPTIVADKSLERSYSAAPAPLVIPLDLREQDAGLYRVRVSGTRKNGEGSTSTSFYLRHEK